MNKSAVDNARLEASKLSVEAEAARGSESAIAKYRAAIEAAQRYIVIAPPDASDVVAWTNFINEASGWVDAQSPKDYGDEEDEEKADAVAKSEIVASRLLGEDWEKSLETNKNGDPTSVPFNATLFLRYHKDVRGTIRWNDFSKEIEVTGGPLVRAEKAPPIDVLAVAAEDWLQEDAGMTVRHADLKRRIYMIAMENRYNPLVDYLNSLVWDGVPRIDNFLIKYLGARTTSASGADITEHVRRISRRWFISAVSRGLNPGCQVDTVLILEGPSGLRKSSCFRILNKEFGCETDLKIGGDKDSKMLASSSWIIELAEMDSIRGRETSTINAYLTQREDFFRAPYGQKHERAKRICVFVGTTNREQYIEDPTGDRRYWPVWVTKIDIKGIEEDRDQFWAEAVAIYKAGGTQKCSDCATSWDNGGERGCVLHRWWLNPEEQVHANEQAAERAEPLAVQDKVLDWWLRLSDSALTSRSVDPNSFSIGDVADGALKLPTERWQAHQKMIGMVLKRLKFERFCPMINGVRSWRYRPSEELRAMRTKKA